MPTVAVGNARVRYAVDGSGAGLVLVHGTGPGAEVTWGHLVDRFTDRRAVIRPDLSGSDEAVDDDGGELTVERLAVEVAAVIEDAADGPVDLVGFSLGAPVVAAVAATRPELVRRLIPVAGFCRPDDEYVRNLVTVWLRIAADQEAFGRFGALTGFSRGFLNGIGRQEVEKLVANMKPTPSTLRQLDLILRLEIRRLLPKIRAQTLVVGCTEDRTVPVGNSRELHSAIAGSRYAEIDSGHVVLYEQPAAFAELVKDFIDEP